MMVKMKWKARMDVIMDKGSSLDSQYAYKEALWVSGVTWKTVHKVVAPA